MAKEPYVGKEVIEAAIGRGIWNWHSVEHSLSFLFAMKTGTTHIGDEAFLPLKIFWAVLDNTVYLGWQNEAKALSFNGKTARSSD